MLISKEIALMVIIVTLIISFSIIIKVKKKIIFTTDGIFSMIGFGIGLIITFLNMIYSNNYLITLGPILAIASALYLRFRNKILINGMDFNLNFHIRTLKMINALYWITISIALISYQQAPPYFRPPIFFISISLGAAILGLEIISSRFDDDLKTFGIISKIILVSLIIRASAYFISPYSIGNDPWGHADFINDISRFGSLNAPQTPTAIHYFNYPLMHIFVVFINLIGFLDLKESMFYVGVVLVLSTVFVYFIVKKITGNINLALLSMLMINFADFHIEWSIEIIAMSFGIAIYSILLYLIMKKDENHRVLYTLFLIMFIFIIIWTHTVSGFIALISVISLYVGTLIYKLIYKEIGYEYLVSFIFCILFIVLLLNHWMDPNYSFFDSTIRGLKDSLSLEAKFLDRTTNSNITELGDSILNVLGFLIYIFFGIIGSLYCLQKKCTSITKVSLIFMLVVLFFIFLAFPVFGMRNILPYRWPAFIYVSLVLFTGIGLMGFLSILKSKYLRTAFILFVLFVSSFFMITNFITNMDSPIYGKEIIKYDIWTESEIQMFEKINKSYDGIVVTDSVTADRPFRTYLRREEIAEYPLTTEGNIDFGYLNDKMVIWRKISLSRPIMANSSNNLDTLLGTQPWEKVKSHLDNNFSNIYDAREARTYLKTLQ